MNDSRKAQETSMSITTTSTNPRTLIAAAIFSVIISSFGAICSAADTAEASKTVVKYGDLDLSTSQGAAVLYNRIHFAAEGVCSSLNGRDLSSKAHWEICVKQAITGAVTTVNRPTLSLVYAAKYGVPPSNEILTAQR
jgi:UrcA family protein